VKRARTKSVPELLRADRNAVTIFIILIHLAGGRRQLWTTRKRIREVCRLPLRRVTLGINALHRAGWIIRKYRRHGIKQFYVIVLPTIDFAPIVLRPDATSSEVSKPTHRGRSAPLSSEDQKRTHRGAKSMRKNDPQRRPLCGIKTEPPSLEEGGSPSADTEGTAPKIDRARYPALGMAAEEILRIRQRKALAQATTQTEVASK
jgi:hypothetical protein